MSPSVRERLRELETEMQDLQIKPAASVRARGRTRARRQMVATGLAVVAVAGTVAYAWPHSSEAPPPIAADRPAIPCVLTLPDSPADVRIRVIDGGAPTGSVDATLSGLRTRGFTVLNDKTQQNPSGTATVVYGPAGIGAATLVRAEVYGQTGARFDPDRRDATVDLVLGPAFTRLASTTELNQSLVTAGEPSAPPQCVRR